MNATVISHLSDSELLVGTSSAVQRERESTVLVLKHLLEIETRQLFAREGFSSLYEMCVKRFGYSESAALRRIDAMRVLKRVPEVEQKIEAGELKLSQLAQVQSFLKVERKEAGRTYSATQTLEILEQVQGQSSRGTECVLLAKSPALQEKRQTEEKIRQVSPTHTELKLIADTELMDLLEQAKALLAHGKEMNPSLALIMKKGLQALIEQQKKRKQRGTAQKDSAPQVPAHTGLNLAPQVREHTGLNSAPQVPDQTHRNSPPTSEFHEAPIQIPTSRYIEAELKRDAFTRAQDCCEFKTKNGQRCTSRYALELHHLLPFALGGEHAGKHRRLLPCS